MPSLPPCPAQPADRAMSPAITYHTRHTDVTHFIDTHAHLTSHSKHMHASCSEAYLDGGGVICHPVTHSSKVHDVEEGGVVGDGGLVGHVTRVAAAGWVWWDVVVGVRSAVRLGGGAVRWLGGGRVGHVARKLDG